MRPAWISRYPRMTRSVTLVEDTNTSACLPVANSEVLEWCHLQHTLSTLVSEAQISRAYHE